MTRTAEPGDRIGNRMPIIDLNNPAEIEAFYGNFSFCDHWRKTVLSNCKEIVRAKYELAGAKITESRIEDLARTHDTYMYPRVPSGPSGARLGSPMCSPR